MVLVSDDDPPIHLGGAQRRHKGCGTSRIQLPNHGARSFPVPSLWSRLVAACAFPCKRKLCLNATVTSIWSSFKSHEL